MQRARLRHKKPVARTGAPIAVNRETRESVRGALVKTTCAGARGNEGGKSFVSTQLRLRIPFPAGTPGGTRGREPPLTAPPDSGGAHWHTFFSMLAPIAPLHPSAGARAHICAPANRSLAPKPDCRHDCFPPGRFRRPRRSSVDGPMGDGCGRRPLRARGAGGRTPGGGGRSWVGRCAARRGRNRGDGAPARASPAPGAPTGGGPH